MYIQEQENVLENEKKNMLVSASAGSGKTYIMIKYITKLICEKRVPVKDLLVLTFTKTAATEMKERLIKNLKTQKQDQFILEQIDSISIANISTIHSFCEKCLKKYSNLLSLNENFVVLDENQSQNIRQIAFTKTLNNFEKTSTEEYIELMDCFKNNTDKIKTVVLKLESLTNSVADKDGFLQEQYMQTEVYFEKAIEFLYENTISSLKESLMRIKQLNVDEFEKILTNLLSPIFSSRDLFEMSKAIKNFKFPFLPKRKEVGDEIVAQLGNIKLNINKCLEGISILNLNDEETVQYQRNGKLEKILLKLFSLYEQQENEIKNLQNCLDFYDLEKYMKILSTKEDLFSGISYVFVDEYQDTNKVQEKIIKNIAKNSNFVAVGDVKQGIYGFRLASSEIFLNDLKEFQQDENSTVKYLQSNFRSNPKILSFVNDIFKVCMTKEISGVDYKESSMLNGMKRFEEDGCKAINIDLLRETKQMTDEDLPKVYSVKNAKIKIDNEYLKQMLAIKNQIMNVMSSKIFEDGIFRKCKYSDIAILSRKRDGLFNQLEMYLQTAGIPVISNSRNILMDEVEIKVLLNYLKIALNPQDDIAMLSVLLSNLSDINLETIIREKDESEFSLCETVKIDKNGKFRQFNENLKSFRENCQIFGIYKALTNLFNATNYRVKINLTSSQQQTNIFIDKFLDEILVSGFEYDLPSLIKYFENVECVINAEPSVVEDSVLMTTIHNSKGLEYPIVFLIGCGQSLKKSQPNDILEINEEYGLAVKYYDKENNNEIVTARMKAIKENEKQKDFVEELFIFYVALTRAKNRLYMFGEFKDSQLEKYTIKDCDSYFDLIFYAIPKLKQNFEENEEYQDEDIHLRLIDEIYEEKLEKLKHEEKTETIPQIDKQLKEYLNFSYKYDDNLNFKLKESVTSLNNKNQDNALAKFSNDNFNFGDANIEIGNAYHLALKTLAFEKIEKKDDLRAEIHKNNNVFADILKFLDFDILFENISILKKITENGKIYKEKEFIMKEKISDLLPNESFDDKIMVQGIVDLFVVKKDEIVLVDFKWTNSTNPQYLVQKYKNQLNLYKKALENTFNLPVKNAYLLSLKNHNLIEVDI